MDFPILLSFLLPPAAFAFVLGTGLLGQPRPPACPECGAGQSIWINPLRKTRRMWFEGGYRCPNCDCEIDMQGVRVAPGTPPSPAAVRARVALWRSAVVSTAACLAFIFALTLVMLRWADPAAPPTVVSPLPPTARPDR